MSAAASRLVSAGGRMRRERLRAPAGLSLADALAAPVLASGIRGGAADLAGLRLAPFAFVMPAESSDPAFVAYYSETHRPAGEVVIESGTATVGTRDGAPFLHAHAVWREADGRRGAGHILPLETRVAADAEFDAWGIGEAEMVALPDPETNFTLFQPRALGPAPADADGVLGWLRPGEDIVDGVGALCRRHGAAVATIHSIVGSVAGARFESGARVETVPTELFLRGSRVSPDGIDLDFVLVDQHGTIHEGRLVRGGNPILICAEIVLSFGAG